jgi:hypothetical protein
MDPTSPASDLPLFDGFPYLAVRVVSAMRHVTLLPREWPLERLDTLARGQVAANRLPAALVLSARRALYYQPADTPGGVVGPPDARPAVPGLAAWLGRGRRAASPPPRGGVLVRGGLEPPAPVPATPDVEARARGFAAWVARHQRRDGFLMGDLWKGGRPATREEIFLLSGFRAGGRVPWSLERCQTCHRWAGTCLDPNQRVFRNLVVRVHCACDNDNRCARCGQPLGEFKLNANYFDEPTRQVWHVPGFEAFRHRCPDGRGRSALRDAVTPAGHGPDPRPGMSPRRPGSPAGPARFVRAARPGRLLRGGAPDPAAPLRGLARPAGPEMVRRGDGHVRVGGRGAGGRARHADGEEPGSGARLAARPGRRTCTRSASRW